jgi:hypothetical protein
MVIIIMGIQPGWVVRTTSNVRMPRQPGLEEFLIG